MIKQHLRTLRSKNFDRNIKRIDRENQSGIELILWFYMLILIFNVAGEVVKAVNILNMPGLMFQIVYVALSILLYFFVLRRKERNYTFWIYTFEIPMLVITLISGTVMKGPNEMTFTFLFLLMLLPILILDKPWRVITFILTFAIAFAVVDHGAKNPATYSRDMVHLLNVCMMTIAASFYFSSGRMRNIEFADYFAEQADRDPLTGLYNRAGCERHIDPLRPGILLYMDLDQFKQVNDKFGHAKGDDVLVEAANALRANFRNNDVLVRMGGDEFAVYAPGKWTQGGIEIKLSALLDSIRKISVTGDDGTIFLSASIGCVFTPNGYASLDSMVRTADRRMYEVKNSGKDNYSIEVMQHDF